MIETPVDPDDDAAIERFLAALPVTGRTAYGDAVGPPDLVFADPADLATYLAALFRYEADDIAENPELNVSVSFRLETGTHSDPAVARALIGLSGHDRPGRTWYGVNFAREASRAFVVWQEADWIESFVAAYPAYAALVARAARQDPQ